MLTGLLKISSCKRFWLAKSPLNEIQVGDALPPAPPPPPPQKKKKKKKKKRKEKKREWF